MAPELCQEIAYDNKVDVWSVGVITFILLTGQPPFFDNSSKPSKEGIYYDIIHNEPKFDLLTDASPELLDFIRVALKKDSN